MPTVGNLQPVMIGRQHVRINRHGTVITGLLADMRVTTESSNTTGFHAPNTTYKTWVSITIGRTFIGNMPTDHPVSLLEEDRT